MVTANGNASEPERRPMENFNIEGTRDVKELGRALESGRINVGDLPERVLRQLGELVDKGGLSPRTLSGVLKSVTPIVKHNAEITMKLMDKVVPDQHNLTLEVTELKKALAAGREDERYVQLERERALKNGSVAGANGHNGQSRQMGNG